MHIFGIPIDNISRKHALHYFHDAMELSGFHQVVTVNPEFLLMAEERGDFRRALLEADLRLADGVGITLAFALRGDSLIERLPGADLVASILTMAAAHDYVVYCAVREDGLSSFVHIKEALERKYPRIKIAGRAFTKDEWQTADLSEIRGDILLCNFGIPEQELFLSRFKNMDTPFHIGLGIGGAFDYLTGAVQRAPKALRFLGLEWLWRLIRQPKRFPRIFRAVVVFPIRLLFGRI